MLRLFVVLCTSAFFAVLAGCSSAPSPPSVMEQDEPPSGSTVWAIDLIRTLPNAQADYVQSIQDNWAGARRLALEQEAVVSYRALVTPPDSALGWDVMLMTEYADSSAWANREEIFQAIFASPEFVAVEPARPSAEMRAFVGSSIAMQAFVDQP